MILTDHGNILGRLINSRGVHVSLGWTWEQIHTPQVFGMSGRTPLNIVPVIYYSYLSAFQSPSEASPKAAIVLNKDEWNEYRRWTGERSGFAYVLPKEEIMGYLRANDLSGDSQTILHSLEFWLKPENLFYSCKVKTKSRIERIDPRWELSLFLGVLQSPISRFVNVLNLVLEEKKKREEKDADDLQVSAGGKTDANNQPSKELENPLPASPL